MFPWGFVVLGVAVVAVLVMLFSTIALAFGSVDRKRVERFALREALWVTPGNGNTVIRYLATTRRWRGGLLYLVVVGSFAVHFVRHSEGNISLLPAFCGWFVGAVIAEWRVDSLARGPRGVAMLHRRQLPDYVRRPVLVLTASLWLAVPALAVVALVSRAVRPGDWQSTVLASVATAVAGASILLVSRRVLNRPQPVVAPDLIEADNAIRARSLNVLTGCALAIGGYLGAVFLGEIVRSQQSATVQLVHLFGFAVLPIAGVLVARAPRVAPVTVSSRTLAA